jgi:hypothetical protein
MRIENRLARSQPWRDRVAGVIAVAALGVACDRTPAGPDGRVAGANSATKSAVEVRAGTQEDSHRTYGSAVRVGNGSARSYLVIQNGRPQELGIALSENALTGLPVTGMSHEYLLPLPARNPTQFKVIELDWNPGGHPPPMVYTVPHFDFHFYVISLAERNAIVPSDPAFATKAANFPPADFRTPGWVPPPGPAAAEAVPRMGIHWINPTSPEFHGLGFTKTFILGSWNGRVTFFEPMVTQAYLLGKPDDLTELPSAPRYEPAGWYPRAYRVRWDAGSREWHVAISRLEPYGELEDDASEDLSDRNH